MTDNLSYDEQCLLDLISAALTGPGGAVFEKSPDWSAVFQLAKSHAVCSLLYDVLADRADLPEEFKKISADESRKTVLQSYRLLFLSRAVVDLIEEMGVPAVILKGASISGRYPVPELRKSGDVDVLILEPERIDDVCRRLGDFGFTPSPDQHSEHHVKMKTPDNIEVEIHTMLTEPFDSKSTNQYIRGLTARCADSVVLEDVMGVRLPRLGDAYQAYSLLLHMLQHFLRAGFGLKLLCDWVTFWNHTYDEETKALYLKLIKDSGVKGFSDIVTKTCVRYLGLRCENVSFMLDGKSPELNDADIAAFIREVFDAEEFGKSDKNRMVALRGTRIFDFIREFHHQTCLNFPRASKVFLLWPLLWALTLWRFLRNNRKLRGVSTRLVLKNARERGKLINKLKLFEAAPSRASPPRPQRWE